LSQNLRLSSFDAVLAGFQLCEKEEVSGIGELARGTALSSNRWLASPWAVGFATGLGVNKLVRNDKLLASNELSGAGRVADNASLPLHVELG
jgi:hypothetical protein